MADEKRKVMSLSTAKEHFCSYMDERILLSLAMNDMDSFYTLESLLDKGDFLSPEHSTLYTILRYMHDDLGVKTFDKPKILDCAKNNQALSALGGSKYLDAIYDMPVNPRNIEVHLRKVLDSSNKYKLYQSIAYANELLNENSENLTADDLIAKIETDLMTFVVGKGIDGPKDMAEGLQEYLEERKENQVEQSGLDTGFPILNKQIDGLTSGALHVIAARKKMGKSTVLSAIARYVAYILKLPVLYVDTELTFEEWRTRQIAAITQTEERLIKHGKWSAEDQVRIDKLSKKITTGKLFHEYMPGYDVDRLVALYKKYKSKHGIALAVFDYIKEPDSKSLDRQRKEYQILGDVATKLKDLAGKLNIPVLTAVQLNRAEDIADSDRIARYADIVAFWEAREEAVMKKEVDETPERKPRGSHRLVIKDTRRGGSTPPEGITYYFSKTKLIVTEVPPHLQAVDYSGVVNYGSADPTDEDTLA